MAANVADGGSEYLLNDFDTLRIGVVVSGLPTSAWKGRCQNIRAEEGETAFRRQYLATWRYKCSKQAPGEATDRQQVSSQRAMQWRNNSRGFGGICTQRSWQLNAAAGRWEND
jgi:hypothetical protein